MLGWKRKDVQLLNTCPQSLKKLQYWILRNLYYGNTTLKMDSLSIHLELFNSKENSP